MNIIERYQQRELLGLFHLKAYSIEITSEKRVDPVFITGRLSQLITSSVQRVIKVEFGCLDTEAIERLQKQETIFISCPSEFAKGIIVENYKPVWLFETYKHNRVNVKLMCVQDKPFFKIIE